MCVHVCVDYARILAEPVDVILDLEVYSGCILFNVSLWGLNCIWLTCFSHCGLFADIVECHTDEHNCSQDCSNTVGSFKCGCRAGYSLQEDGVTCTGVHPFMSIFTVVSEFPVAFTHCNHSYDYT